MKADFKEAEFSDRFFNCLQFFVVVAKEIAKGINKDMIPAHRWCYQGMALGLALHFYLDQRLLAHFGYSIHLPELLRSLLVYFSILSGWLMWGVRRAVLRNRLSEALTEVFEECKWKRGKKLPAFIEDEVIDGPLRKLRLKTNGVTYAEFESGTEKFQAMLNVTVVRLCIEDNDRHYIDILYTTKDLTLSPVLGPPESFNDGDVPIGVTYEGAIVVNLRDVAHILVAGQTTGGKSNFLKVASSTLTATNPDANLIFLDFKAGMEGADLRKQLKHDLGNMRGNITYFSESPACVAELARLGPELVQRLQTLTKHNVVNFDEYVAKRLQQKTDESTEKIEEPLRKLYIVIDEMAQLYAREPGVDKKLLEQARESVNRIARQGRAAGVHLICATQKPEASSFDQTVKANMPGVLCFPMTNQQSSVSALGTKRAFELNPKLKGRAIWKFGADVREVQTYLFT